MTQSEIEDYTYYTDKDLYERWYELEYEITRMRISYQEYKEYAWGNGPSLLESKQRTVRHHIRRYRLLQDNIDTIIDTRRRLRLRPDIETTIEEEHMECEPHEEQTEEDNAC